MNKIWIYVSGGVVQEVYVNSIDGIEVIVNDMYNESVSRPPLVIVSDSTMTAWEDAYITPE